MKDIIKKAATILFCIIIADALVSIVKSFVINNFYRLDEAADWMNLNQGVADWAGGIATSAAVIVSLFLVPITEHFNKKRAEREQYIANFNYAMDYLDQIAFSLSEMNLNVRNAIKDGEKDTIIPDVYTFAFKILNSHRFINTIEKILPENEAARFRKIFRNKIHDRCMEIINSDNVTFDTLNNTVSGDKKTQKKGMYDCVLECVKILEQYDVLKVRKYYK